MIFFVFLFNSFSVMLSFQYKIILFSPNNFLASSFQKCVSDSFLQSKDLIKLAPKNKKCFDSMQQSFEENKIASVAKQLKDQYNFKFEEAISILLKSPRLVLKGLTPSNHAQLHLLEKHFHLKSFELASLLQKYPYFFNTTSIRTQEIIHFYEDTLQFDHLSFRKLILKFPFAFFHKNANNLYADYQLLSEKYGFTLLEIRKLILNNPFLFLHNQLLSDYHTQERIDFFKMVFALPAPPSLPFRKFILSHPRLFQLSLEKFIQPNVETLSKYFNDHNHLQQEDPQQKMINQYQRVRIMLYKLRSLLNYNPEILENRILNRFYFLTTNAADYQNASRKEYANKQSHIRLFHRNRRRQMINDFQLCDSKDMNWKGNQECVAVEDEGEQEDEETECSDSSSTMQMIEINPIKADLIYDIVSSFDDSSKAIYCKTTDENSHYYPQLCHYFANYANHLQFTTKEARRIMQLHSIILTTDIEMMKFQLSCFAVTLGLSKAEFMKLIRICPMITTMTWNKKLFFLLRNLAEYAERYLDRRMKELENIHPNSSAASLVLLIVNEIQNESDSTLATSTLSDNVFENDGTISSEDFPSFQQAIIDYRNHPIRFLLRNLFLLKPHLPSLSQATLLERLEFWEQYRIAWKDLPEVLTRSKAGFNNYIFKNHFAALHLAE